MTVFNQHSAHFIAGKTKMKFGRPSFVGHGEMSENTVRAPSAGSRNKAELPASFRRQSCGEPVPIHRRAGSAGHHFASAHDQIPIRKLVSEIVVLLHQQNGQTHLGDNFTKRFTYLLDD